jgi:salicylate hydroxylase
MPSATPPQKPYSLAVVGGGISGLVLGLTLLEYNIPITIYEAASHFGEIGAGVAFGPNACRAMQQLSPKICEAFSKCRTGNGDDSKSDSWFTVRVGDGRKANKEGYVREGKKVGDGIFEIRLPSGGGRGGVLRAHFLDELVKEVPDDVAKFDKRLVDMAEADDGSGDMVLKFADGSTAKHTAVIGCDGIKSFTRKWVVGRDNPASTAVFSGKYAYRGLIPMDKAVELVGSEAARNSQLYLGYHGHLLTFPIAHGKIMNGMLTISKC